ncbi:MAG: hypothetical protein CBC13_04585 [Planctomycetia bacterium TMED53]|nr:MAG: hypothetical protein CBC13_04585 [Planctomycetia bacterium TMED53]
MQKSWPLFVTAIAIEAVSVLLLAFCIIAYVEIGDLAKAAGEPNIESMNWFSRYILDSATESMEGAVFKPSDLIRAANNQIFLLGGLSVFASFIAIIMLISNAKSPHKAKEV